MRSRKALPNKKNRGHFLPQPTRTTASDSAPELRPLGAVMLSVGVAMALPWVGLSARLGSWAT